MADEAHQGCQHARTSCRLRHRHSHYGHAFIWYVAVMRSASCADIGTLCTGAYGFSGVQLMPLSAVLFLISDLFVAREAFVSPGSINALVGLPLYYVSQVLFGWSIYVYQHR